MLPRLPDIYTLVNLGVGGVGSQLQQVMVINCETAPYECELPFTVSAVPLSCLRSTLALTVVRNYTCC